MREAADSIQQSDNAVGDLRRGLLESAVIKGWLKRLKTANLLTLGEESRYSPIAQVFLDAIFSNDRRMPRDCAVVLCEMLETELQECEPCLKVLASLYAECCKQICLCSEIKDDIDSLLERATNLLTLTSLRIKGNPPSQDIEFGARDALNRIQWLLQKSLGNDESDHQKPQPYGDLAELNQSRVILEAVGDSLLREIAEDTLGLVDTAAAVFEANGDYALGTISSSWCRYMDLKSRQLTDGDNQAAMNSGRWYCHESALSAAKKAIATGQSTDLPCRCGIRVFAAPIRAGNEIVGAFTIGYGDPPRDPSVLEQLSEIYGADKDELTSEAQKYHCRPPFIIEQSKKRILSGALLIGEIVARRQSKMEIQILNSLLKDRIIELEPAEREKLKLADIVNQSDDAIMSCDDDAKVISWNKAAERIYGYSAEDIIGKSIYILTPEIKQEEIEYLTERLQSGKPLTQYETYHTKKDGHVIPVSVTVSAIRNDSDAPTEWSLISRDITERTLAEESLKKTSRELERSNSELRQFAFAAAHDLQEPLRAMSNYSDLLSSKYAAFLDDRGKKYISRIAESSERMQALIQDLLHYSRVDTHGKPFSTVDLDEVLTSALKNLRLSLEESNVFIKSEKLPVMKADRSQMLLLFQNLVSNAIKYRSSDSPAVHISAKCAEETLTLCFEDNGIGIDDEHFERIFVIFQRLHTRDEYPGTGMGLAICKRIVERHEGRIWVESQVGKGSKFFVRLPLTSGAHTSGYRE